VFFVNQGPWCSGEKTEKDPACSALDPAAPRVSGLYPADLQADKAFCDKLAKDKRHAELLSPFTALVREDTGALGAVPYSAAFKDDMTAVSRELTAAAEALKGTDEAPLAAYLAAAARAFLDNDWSAADEAWTRVSAESSKWYLRVAPDETYFEPCSVKAGFHVTFGRQDKASQGWQKKLEPVKNDMERALAALAGPPYVAREVAFHLPDFIEVIVNAGDSRDARGAVLGQSLPNWGPVANEGRGRTVAMANFYTDPESKRVLREQAASVLCADALGRYADDADDVVLGTVLHEAAHNLGPSSEYKVNAKTDEQVFGGPVASMLEELKAQTSALYLTAWLADKGLVSRDLAERAHLRELTWALSHLSRGTLDGAGKLKPYGALAAVQVGSLLQEGALVWKPNTLAGNRKDKGCLEVDFAKLPAATAKLEAQVLAIKARGDAAGASRLVRAFVNDPRALGPADSAVAERYLSFPRPSYLYAVRL
jgi:hypothetical protein